MTVVAFAPKEAFKDPDALGAVYVNDSVSVDVRERVAESEDGVFVVDNPAVIAALDKYTPLKRVKVPSEVREAEQAEREAAAAAQAAAEEEARRIAEEAEKAAADAEKDAEKERKAAAKRAARQGGDN